MRPRLNGTRSCQRVPLADAASQWLSVREPSAGSSSPMQMVYRWVIAPLTGSCGGSQTQVTCHLETAKWPPPCSESGCSLLGAQVSPSGILHQGSLPRRWQDRHEGKIKERTWMRTLRIKSISLIPRGRWETGLFALMCTWALDSVGSRALSANQALQKSLL